MTSRTDRGPQIECGFSLRKVANFLKDYIPPPVGSFDPSGSWRQSYAMFVLQGGGVRVGEFCLERSVKGAEKFVLTVQTRRSGNSGFSQFQHAEMQCQSDTLATPLSWVFETKMAQNPGDPPYLGSGRRSSAGVSGGMLAIRNGLRTRRTPIEGPYSNEWTLLEAVNRLPGEETKEIDYTLIDEFDAPHSGHRMSYGNKAQVALHSGPAEITGYCDLGPAVVPTTYWVDEHHRLIFVCTGLMVYALSGTNGQAGQSPDRYPLIVPMPPLPSYLIL